MRNSWQKTDEKLNLFELLKKFIFAAEIFQKQLKTKNNMKKLSTILAVIAVVSLASCKKDYTCECKSTPSDSFYDYSTTFHAKKADAKTACDVLDYTTSNGTSTVTVNCEIK